MFNKKLLLLPLIILLASCVKNPPYKFVEGEKTASLKLMNGGSATMCKGGELYSLDSEPGTNVVQVPVDERLSIGTYMSYSGYNVTYSCYPFLSFKPVEGHKYITDSNVVFDKCFIDLVREDSSSVTGLAVDKSIGPRDCYASRKYN